MWDPSRYKTRSLHIMIELASLTIHLRGIAWGTFMLKLLETTADLFVVVDTCRSGSAVRQEGVLPRIRNRTQCSTREAPAELLVSSCACQEARVPRPGLPQSFTAQYERTLRKALLPSDDEQNLEFITTGSLHGQICITEPTQTIPVLADLVRGSHRQICLHRLGDERSRRGSGMSTTTYLAPGLPGTQRSRCSPSARRLSADATSSSTRNRSNSGLSRAAACTLSSLPSISPRGTSTSSTTTNVDSADLEMIRKLWIYEIEPGTQLNKSALLCQPQRRRSTLKWLHRSLRKPKLLDLQPVELNDGIVALAERYLKPYKEDTQDYASRIARNAAVLSYFGSDAFSLECMGYIKCREAGRSNVGRLISSNHSEATSGTISMTPNDGDVYGLLWKLPQPTPSAPDIRFTSLQDTILNEKKVAVDVRCSIARAILSNVSNLHRAGIQHGFITLETVVFLGAQDREPCWDYDHPHSFGFGQLSRPLRRLCAPTASSSLRKGFFKSFRARPEEIQETPGGDCAQLVCYPNADAS